MARTEREGRGAQGTATRRLERVQKRDGRQVPFDVTKIRDAVQKALVAVGAGDPSFAGEVAAVVEMGLCARASARVAGDAGTYVPNIEEIQDLVERALMELGLSAAAKAYILHREKRARIRDALSVGAAPSQRGTPRVRERETTAPWSKGRIVAALMEEAELPRALSEEIAAAVERRVFASGERRVSTGLVRELVASELAERGLTQALRRASPLSLARSDLVRLLDGHRPSAWEESLGAREPPAPERALAGELLARLALDDLLPDVVADLHQAGDLFVEDLRAPHRPLSLAVDARLLAGSAGAERANAALDALAELGSGATRWLALEDPSELLLPLLRATRPGSALGLRAWLAALTAISRAAGTRIALSGFGVRHVTCLARVVQELAELPPAPQALVVFADGYEMEELLTAHAELAPILEALLAEERLVPTWHGPEEGFAAPGSCRSARERGLIACTAAVALNLPRLARRAGPWREDLVQSGIADLVQAALDGARALDAFQSAHRGGGSLAGLRVRSSLAIVPVGLREALLVLGGGTIDADQGARLLGLVGEAAARFAREAARVCAPAPFYGERAAARFAWLDRRSAALAHARQAWLFGEAEESASERPYSDGYLLGPIGEAGAGRLEAELVRATPSGALHVARGPRGAPAPAGSDGAHLAAWRRFEVRRRAGAGELALELFPSRARLASVPKRCAPALFGPRT
jgi:hypothetical protein